MKYPKNGWFMKLYIARPRQVSMLVCVLVIYIKIFAAIKTSARARDANRLWMTKNTVIDVFRSPLKTVS